MKGSACDEIALRCKFDHKNNVLELSKCDPGSVALLRYIQVVLIDIFSHHFSI